MRKFFAAVLTVAIVVAPIAAANIDNPTAPGADDSIRRWSGEVAMVSTGDTMYITSKNGERSRVKLYGIAAPKNKQDFGAAARKFLRGLADKKKVSVATFWSNERGRDVVVANPYGDSAAKNFNAAMIKAGLARVDDAWCNASACDRWRDYQTQAQTDRRGIWSRPPTEKTAAEKEKEIAERKAKREKESAQRKKEIAELQAKIKKNEEANEQARIADEIKMTKIRLGIEFLKNISDGRPLDAEEFARAKFVLNELQTLGIDVSGFEIKDGTRAPSVKQK